MTPCPLLPEPLEALGWATSWWGDPQKGSQLGAKISLTLSPSSSVPQAGRPLPDSRLSFPPRSREVLRAWSDL